MSVLEWLCDRSATCERLRSECSLREPQVNCLTDDLEAARVLCAAAQEGALALCQEVQVLQAAADERDGLMRELWLERRRNDELRDRLRLTDSNVNRLVVAMAKQEADLRAWINRLLQDIELQKQLRIEAQAELETLKGKGVAP